MHDVVVEKQARKLQATLEGCNPKLSLTYLLTDGLTGDNRDVPRPVISEKVIEQAVPCTLLFAY